MFWGLFIFILSFFPSSPYASESTHFVIVVPSYNNEPWVIRNLESITSQNYSNWFLYYIDDHSTDKTAKLVKKFIKEKNLQSKCQLIRNSERKGALANLYAAIHKVNPTDVIVTVDGDDRFAHSKVLSVLAGAYADKKVWMTYGNFKSDPPGWPSNCRPISNKIAKKNCFRKKNFVSSHLRTFYAKLFQLINKKDLFWNGQFYPMTWDMAIMFPMIEMASKGHFRFIKEVLYIYNVQNPLMDCRVNAQLQRDLDKEIRSKPPYKPLNTLF